MGPADVATDDLLSHILPFLPAGPRRILDVGCGNRLLASRLQRLSHDVVAIDESSDLVNEATSLGLKARVASWPDFEDDPFDVIMFVASLHHLRPLHAGAHIYSTPNESARRYGDDSAGYPCGDRRH